MIAQYISYRFQESRPPEKRRRAVFLRGVQSEVDAIPIWIYAPISKSRTRFFQHFRTLITIASIRRALHVLHSYLFLINGNLLRSLLCHDGFLMFASATRVGVLTSYIYSRPTYTHTHKACIKFFHRFFEYVKNDNEDAMFFFFFLSF